MARSFAVQGREDVMSLKTIKDEPDDILVTDIQKLVVSSQDGSYQRTIEEVSVVLAERFMLPGQERI